MAGYIANRLPRQPGRSGWEAILHSREQFACLEANLTADVAIVGAGFAGLSAARRIGQLDPTASVAVLEAGAVGEGPAGRNSGFMIDLPHNLSSDDYAGKDLDHDRNVIANNRIAIGFARNLAAESQMPSWVFNPCGKVNAAATDAGDAHNQRFRDYLGKLGEDCRALDAAEMQALTGTKFYTSGLQTPGTVLIQPAAYIRRLAESLGQRLTVYEGSPVLKIRRDGHAWHLETKNSAVSAKRVILATNGHAESFGLFRRRLMHIFTYASMTRALTTDEVRALGGTTDWGVTPADPMGATVRRISGAGGDRIVVRARFSYDPSMEVSPARIKRVGALHDDKFRDRFPMLPGVSMEFRWAGHLCLSRNGVPAFGEVEDGLISAVCQNGLGTVQGTLSGMAAAEVALGQPKSAAAALAGLDAPCKLPPEPLAWIGANATLRWKEWRAGAE